jgi:Carboxypeptidase regulatory-like domain/TonB dependent receptor
MISPYSNKKTWGVYLRKISQVLGGILGVLLLGVPAFSQGNTGRILGSVVDQSGGTVAGATVTVLDKDRGISRTLTTDEAGAYNAPNLTPGNYTVRAESKGFKVFERQNVVLEVGKEIRVDATLQPGEQNQTVTVTEAVPLVETTNATLGGTLNNADIADLPLNGRDYQNLLGLRPGVMLQPGGGPWTQSTNGVRPDETGWMVDGVLNVNFFDARPVVGMPSPFTDGATILPVDAIQEFNLMENPKAEYGLKPGAIVNVGIKSGTNTLHGSAYAFGRTDAWDARNYFNPAPIAGVCTGNPAIPVAACDKLATQLKQFGGVVGGPIKKDKLFFFAGYEGLRSLIGSAFTTNVPGTASGALGAGANPATSMVDAIQALQIAGVPRSAVSEQLLGCTEPTATTASCTGGLYQIAQSQPGFQLSPFPNSNTTDNGIAKIDYHMNDKSSISGMFFLGNYFGLGEDHPFTNQLFTDNSPIRAWTTVVSWVYTPTSTRVNEMHFGYNRVDFGFLNNDASKPANGTSSGYILNSGVTTPVGLPNIYIAPFNGGYLGTNPNRPQSSSPNPYFDFSDSLSVLRGKHSFKFGGEFLHIEADDLIYVSGRGQVHFDGGQNLGGTSTGMEDFFAGSPSRATLLAGSPARKVTWMSTSGFIQDDWRVTPKLIINVGLRYEYTSPMKADHNLFGSFDPTLGMVQQGQAGLESDWKGDHRNFSPRLGFAWDLNGKGTTVVRAGASVMYSSFVLNTFLAEFSLQNNFSTSLAAVPTGAILQTNGCVNGANGCPTAGGTIPLATTSFSASQLTSNWQNNSPTVPLFPAPVAKCGDGLTVGGPLPDAGPCDIMGVDPNLRSPYIVNYNISVTRLIGSNLSLEIGYVGNRGERLLGFRDINQPNIAAGSTVRPFAAKFPYLGFINWGSNQAHSRYDSLQLTATKRMSHGLSFTAGYTYGHGLDNGSLNRFGLLPQDSYRPDAEYGNSDFDIRHRLTATVTYNIPGIKGFGQMLEGWQINSIVNVQTPQPWTISDSTFNISGTGENADRWDIFGNPADFRSGPVNIPFCSGYGTPGGPSCFVGGVNGAAPTPAAASAAVAQCATLAPSQVTLDAAGCYISNNGKSFIIPQAPGTFGNIGRNIFRDSGFRSWDFSVFKNFTFKERYGAQFRVEVFNIINRPTFANPYGASNGFLGGGFDPSSGVLGYAGSTPDFAAGNPLIGSGANRDLQLGLKLTF